jgi:imidazole glycerol-phosphate synthase
MPTVHLLDYVAGNVRSLVNAIEQVGYEVAWVKTPEEVKNADVYNTISVPKRCN